MKQVEQSNSLHPQFCLFFHTFSLLMVNKMKEKRKKETEKERSNSNNSKEVMELWIKTKEEVYVQVRDKVVSHLKSEEMLMTTERFFEKVTIVD